MSFRGFNLTDKKKMTDASWLFYPLIHSASQLDSYEIGEGKFLKLNVSEPKTRLFVGNIPKSKGRDEIEDEFEKLSGNLWVNKASPSLISLWFTFLIIFVARLGYLGTTPITWYSPRWWTTDF
jgi:hypothetical protein